MKLKKTTISKLNEENIESFNSILEKDIYLSYEWLIFLQCVFERDINIVFSENDMKQLEFFLPYIKKFTKGSIRNQSLPLSYVSFPSVQNLNDIKNFENILMLLDEKHCFTSSQKLKNTEIIDEYSISEIDIKKYNNIEDLFASFNKNNIQRKIRKALSDNLELIIDGEKEIFKSFSKIQSLTRHRQGSPDFPKDFFINLKSILKDKAKIFGVKKNNELISASIFLFDDRNKVAKYLYGASNELIETKRVGANQLSLWLGIKHAKESSFEKICLGLTPTNQTSLLQYKNRWGAKKRTVYWLKYHKKIITFNLKRNSIFFYIPIIFLKLLPLRYFKAISKILFKIST